MNCGLILTTPETFTQEVSEKDGKKHPKVSKIEALVSEKDLTPFMTFLIGFMGQRILHNEKAGKGKIQFDRIRGKREKIINLNDHRSYCFKNIDQIHKHVKLDCRCKRKPLTWCNVSRATVARGIQLLVKKHKYFHAVKLAPTKFDPKTHKALKYQDHTMSYTLTKKGRAFLRPKPTFFSHETGETREYIKISNQYKLPNSSSLENSIRRTPRKRETLFVRRKKGKGRKGDLRAYELKHASHEAEDDLNLLKNTPPESRPDIPPEVFERLSVSLAKKLEHCLAEEKRHFMFQLGRNIPWHEKESLWDLVCEKDRLLRAKGGTIMHKSAWARAWRNDPGWFKRREYEKRAMERAAAVDKFQFKKEELLRSGLTREEVADRLKKFMAADAFGAGAFGAASSAHTPPELTPPPIPEGFEGCPIFESDGDWFIRKDGQLYKVA